MYLRLWRSSFLYFLGATLIDSIPQQKVDQTEGTNDCSQKVNILTADVSATPEGRFGEATFDVWD